MLRAAKNSSEHYIISKNMHFLFLWVIENSVIKHQRMYLHLPLNMVFKVKDIFFINRRKNSGKIWERAVSAAEIQLFHVILHHIN